MQTNVPFRLLFNDRLIPLLLKGNTIGLMDNFHNMHSFKMDPNTKLIFYIKNMDKKTKNYLSTRDAFNLLASLISSSNSSCYTWIFVNDEKYIPLSEIEADFPQLECKGRIFKSWKKGCECSN